MHRPLVAYDGIAIAELLFYLLALAAAVSLCLKHGFTKDLGWRAILVLALVRIIGSALRLATIHDPHNINLYIGWQVLDSIGIAPLLLLLIGLLGRALASIPAAAPGKLSIHAAHRRAVLLLLAASVVLFAVGGSRSRVEVVAGQPTTDYSQITKVAVVLHIVVLAATAAGLALAAARIGNVPARERKVVHAVALCLPFVAVRLAYTCLLVFGGKKSSPWLYLGLSSLPEMFVTFVGVILGLRLDVLPKDAVPIPQSDC
ncbi:hypothetical protein ESCO_001316 [Escovopsis weberi]|uniref:DUF7702 domain-containing protein n=1 Tax=Escovopsis weberi TaxID=150374 RepID=A0A0M8N1D6_ESCWE|nr:hypothetical protein ESCO_001316 [Escovopsis weberi]